MKPFRRNVQESPPLLEVQAQDICNDHHLRIHCILFLFHGGRLLKLYSLEEKEVSVGVAER